jgi:hypothetical protein
MRKLKIEFNNIETDKEKITTISLENKDEKYILYSGENINDIDTNLFKLLEFKDTLSITPKTRFNSLGFNTIYDKNTYSYKLTFKNMPVYYSINSKKYIDNDKLKPILTNGQLYKKIYDISEELSYKENITIPFENKNDLVNSLLNKKKESIIEIDLSEKNLDKELLSETLVKTKEVILENQSVENIDDIQETKEIILEKKQVEDVDDIQETKEIILENKSVENIDNIQETKEIILEKKQVEDVNNIQETKEIILENKSVENIDDIQETKEIILEKKQVEEVDNIQETKEIILEKKQVEEVDNIQKTKEVILEKKQVEEVDNIQETKEIILEKKQVEEVDNIQETKEIILENQTLQKEETKKVILNEDKKIEINNFKNEVFDLANILSDFNKLFNFDDKNIINNESENIVNKDKLSEKIVKENTMNLSKQNEDKELFSGTILKENTMNLSKQNEDKELFSGTIVKENTMNLSKQNRNKEVFSERLVKENTINLLKQNGNKEVFNIDKKVNILEYQKIINYQNINYKINIKKLINDNNLNLFNLSSSKILNENIITKNNLSLELENKNSSYLFQYLNQKYLINKIENTLVLTNMNIRNSQIYKNKDIIKIGNIDFIIYNNCTLLIPLITTKIFDNSYGVSFNYYVPRIQ